MEVERVAVVGSGTMGSGIAQVAAMSGLDVVMRDVDQQSLDRGLALIDRSFSSLLRAGKLTEQHLRETRARLRTTTDLPAAIRDADYVFEAIPESLEMKKALFREMDELRPEGVIFASNTSQLSITSVAAGCRDRRRVIGTHWFNPPVLMRLIEVVCGLETADETLQITLALAAKLGKETVVCTDSQGFITTRALAAFRLECIRILEEGVASVEDIDKAVRLAFNHPMGPFELNDFNGLDVGYHSALALEEAFGERFKPPLTLRKMVDAGHLGRKTGQGWYRYDKKS